MTIGEKIKSIRKQNRISQQKLGDMLGVSQAMIAQYETGKRVPKADTLKKIADCLNCSPAYLMGWSDSIKNEETYKLYVDIPASNANEAIWFAMKGLLAESGYHEKANSLTEDEAVELYKTLEFDEPLSYENSYSYASSAEELDKLQDAKQIEFEKKRAKPFKLYETEEEGPPKPFTRPLQSSYDKPNEDHQDNSLKLHTNTRGINWEQLDDFRFDELMLKLDRGEELSSAEIKFKSAYLERCLKKVGYIFAKFYSMLNVEGQKKADEQIDRAIEQVELLTKIPEYQKIPDTPPQE